MNKISVSHTLKEVKYNVKYFARLPLPGIDRRLIAEETGLGYVWAVGDKCVIAAEYVADKLTQLSFACVTEEAPDVAGVIAWKLLGEFLQRRKLIAHFEPLTKDELLPSHVWNDAFIRDVAANNPQLANEHLAERERLARITAEDWAQRWRMRLDRGISRQPGAPAAATANVSAETTPDEDQRTLEVARDFERMREFYDSYGVKSAMKILEALPAAYKSYESQLSRRDAKEKWGSRFIAEQTLHVSTTIDHYCRAFKKAGIHIYKNIPIP
jgi:hypothetical protein